MRNLAKKLYQVSFTMLAVGIVAGCGSSNSSGGGGASPTPTPTPTGGQPQVTCPAHTLAVGDKVAYVGPRSSGTTFSDPSIAYTGTVKQINAHVLVTWDNAGIGDVAVNSTTIVPKVTCSPDLSGKSAEYIGPQAASQASFNDPSHVYFGTVIATYSLGYLEVQWNDYSYHTVEPAANLSVTQ